MKKRFSSKRNILKIHPLRMSFDFWPRRTYFHAVGKMSSLNRKVRVIHLKKDFQSLGQNILFDSRDKEGKINGRWTKIFPPSTIKYIKDTSTEDLFRFLASSNIFSCGWKNVQLESLIGKARVIRLIKNFQTLNQNFLFDSRDKDPSIETR